MIGKGLPLLLVLLSACGAQPPREPDRIYDKARQQFREGKPREALVEVDRTLQRLDSNADSVWRRRFLLMKSQIVLGLGRPQEALNVLDSATPTGADAPEARIRWRMLQGRAYSLLRRFPEADGSLDEALRMASSEAAAPALRAEVQSIRASLFVLTRDWSSAEASARDALEYARRSGDPFLEAAALGNLGDRRLFNSLFDEAVPWYEQCIAISEKHGYKLRRALNSLNMGYCYHRLGDYDKALQLLSRAEREFAKIGDVIQQERCLGNIGNVHLRRGDLATATSSYREALALARQIHATDDISRWQNNLAEASIEMGDLDSAEASNRESVALLEKVRDDISVLWAQLNSAQIAAGRRRFDEAEKLYGETIDSATKLGMTAALLRARSKLGSLYLQLGDSSKAESQFQAIASESESSRSKLGRDEWKLTFQSSVIPFYNDYIEFLMDRGRVAQALEVAESCRARLLAEKLGLERRAIRGATAADFRAKARAEKAVLLSYWLAPRRSFLWVVTPDSVQSFELPPEKEISRLVEAYTNVVLQGRDPIETTNATGLQLFETLVAPARKLIRPGANVIVVPDGSLHELNFETLLVGGEPPRYWIEEATVAIAPSLAVLQPAGRVDGQARRLLLLGSPVSASSEYPPLPGTEMEVGSIENLFTAQERTVMTGAQAHPGAYKEAGPGRFSHIHFSAHAVANRESPLDSAVILSRQGDSYKLYARDVAALPLRAELVTISACRSAGARAYSGEGLVGFTWAFLQAGAHNVIAGLWDVSDRSTSELMANLYSEMANRLGPAESLRAAKLKLLRSSGPYRKPYYWAPFQIFTRSMPFQDRPRYVSQRAKTQ